MVNKALFRGGWARLTSHKWTVHQQYIKNHWNTSRNWRWQGSDATGTETGQIFPEPKIGGAFWPFGDISSSENETLQSLGIGIVCSIGKKSDTTPWKINMEPKNGGLEDYFPFHLGDFEVNQPLNFGGVSKIHKQQVFRNSACKTFPTLVRALRDRCDNLFKA